MVTIRECYERANAAWPAKVPPLTPEAAVNAVKRLYRFATGKKLGWRVEVTSGNRYTWGHDFSHWLDRVALGLGRAGGKPHAKKHAQLERRLVREVVKRGWLEPEPKAEPKPEPAPERPNERAALKLAHASKMLAKADRRLKLATTLAKKWRRRVASYVRKLQPQVTQ